VKVLAPLAAVLALAGCGGGGHGTATLWITRDRGATVLRTTTVPAGVTAMQALDRVADVKTRYGGRFVEAIDGVEGSLTARRDWFYFVNGYEADRGATEYRLRPGDVEWWDFRSWAGDAMAVPVVVGAFPEPFLHGFAGKRRPAAVLYTSKALAPAARRLARTIDAGTVGLASTVPPKEANVLLLLPGAGASFYPEPQAPVHRPGDPVLFVFRGDPSTLLHDRYRFRYRVP
jgi:hypothetical protein